MKLDYIHGTSLSPHRALSKILLIAVISRMTIFDYRKASQPPSVRAGTHLYLPMRSAPLYGQALKARVEFFIEYFAIDLIRDSEGRVRGLVCLKMDDGTIIASAPI